MICTLYVMLSPFAWTINDDRRTHQKANSELKQSRRSHFYQKKKTKRFQFVVWLCCWSCFLCNRQLKNKTLCCCWLSLIQRQRFNFSLQIDTRFSVKWNLLGNPKQWFCKFTSTKIRRSEIEWNSYSVVAVRIKMYPITSAKLHLTNDNNDFVMDVSTSFKQLICRRCSQNNTHLQRIDVKIKTHFPFDSTCESEQMFERWIMHATNKRWNGI